MKRQTTPAAHASGHLTAVNPGILEGSVEFPVRGPISFRMERRASDATGERARLYSKTPGLSFAYLQLHGAVWTGKIRVEGYQFAVRVEPDDAGRWAIAFRDTSV